MDFKRAMRERNAQIIALHRAGMSGEEIGIRFLITGSAVSAIIRNEREAHERKAAFVKATKSTDIAWVRIEMLPLSVRTLNCLTNYKNAGLWNGSRGPTPSLDMVVDLLRWSASDLLKIKNFGRKSLKEVESFLSEHGVALATK